MLKIKGAMAALVVLVLAASMSQAFAGSPKGQWFQAKLASGEIEGYRWSVGVKGPKHAPLSQICAEISMVEPPRDDVPYVEGRDATDCGQLKQATDAVSSTISFGSGESEVTVREVIYRPLVDKVTVIFDTGDQRDYQTRKPRLSNMKGRGIPSFRYVVVPFGAGMCVRRIIALDRMGGVVSKRPGSPC